MLLEQALLFSAVIVQLGLSGYSLDKNHGTTALALLAGAMLCFFTFLIVTFPGGAH